MRPPGGECSDLWGAEFKGSPCHQRVLKPPGGGSSDIFGAGEAQQSPRKVKQYMASNISLTDGAPAPSGPGSTSSAASTASSGETPSPGSPTGTPTRNGTAAGEATQATGQAQAQEQVAAADGNPVTGEGYNKPAPGGAPLRNRVPPGGYSSGLW
ncbi:hypothetical protein ONE63_007599 [Megalurothrips usitatus]|uniref:Microtubule-associated protein Jupiter n=1 Tax=Megalurothrips usitatus TaxID=439358 RepID=A0AAV7XQN8_9NEOP|nr:hypothetical protein ONE63_007599 [Megalurothrips usitatus]